MQLVISFPGGGQWASHCSPPLGGRDQYSGGIWGSEMVGIQSEEARLPLVGEACPGRWMGEEVWLAGPEWVCRRW